MLSTNIPNSNCHLHGNIPFRVRQAKFNHQLPQRRWLHSQRELEIARFNSLKATGQRRKDGALAFALFEFISANLTCATCFRGKVCRNVGRFQMPAHAAGPQMQGLIDSHGLRIHCGLEILK